jgi:hypothetical protein
MSAPAALHFGWLLDLLPKSMVPVTLNGSGLKGHSHDRILCIDLGSPDKPAARLAAASAVLNALWDVTRRQWLEALNRPSDQDARVPVFIVIDEAHNLAPTQPPSDLARSLNEILVRIATEGRKYGLFLMLITQRPHRLDQTVLSQCDNLCLLKMNNRIDLDLWRAVSGSSRRAGPGERWRSV